MDMQERDLKNDENEKQYDSGHKKLVVIAVIEIVLNIVNNVFIQDYEFKNIGIVISIAMSIGLACGVNWIRYLYVISRIFGFRNTLILLSGLSADTSQEWLRYTLIVILIKNIVEMIILTTAKDVNTYIYIREGERERRRKKVATPCPFCSEWIGDKQTFCQFCGGNLKEKDDDNREFQHEKQQECPAVFQQKEELFEDADMFCRLYNKNIANALKREKRRKAKH